jgi:hypothetical protein
MEVYIWFKKRASIPLAPCIFLTYSGEAQPDADELGFVGLEDTENR